MIYETMNAYTIHDTTHMMVGLHHHPDLLPLQGQLTAATSRQNRSSNRRGLSLDSYIGRLSLKGTWKGILEVSAFLVYYITILCSSTSQITRTSQQVWRVHLVYVASGITSSRITQPCGPTSLPTGNRAPSGAVIFSRVECFNLSRHIRRRTDQPVAPHPQADRPTFHYRTCIKHNQKRGTEMADSRSRRQELVEPEACATRRGAQ